jgi:hypothetical protein
VANRPRYDVGDFSQTVREYRGIERTGELTLGLEHVCKLHSQIVEFPFALPLPAWAHLMSVHMKGAPVQSSLPEFMYKVTIEPYAVGNQNRFHTSLLHHGYDLYDAGMCQRLSARYEHCIASAQPQHRIDFMTDLIQRFLTLRVVRGKAGIARDVAFSSGLEPRHRIIRRGPGQAKKLAGVDARGR